MIIPPDPEKDPRLFAESRASLVTVEADLVDLADLDGPQLPAVAYHPPGTYPYDASPFADDFAVYPAEDLPPYEGRRARTSAATVAAAATAAGEQRQRRSTRNSGPPTGLLVRTTSVSGSSTSSRSSAHSSFGRLLSTRRASSTRPDAVDAITPTSTTSTAVHRDDDHNERSKLWEGLVIDPSDKKQWCGIPIPGRPRVPVSPEMRDFWRKHRRWIILLSILVGGAILVGAGLAAGFVSAMKTRKNDAKQKTWHGKPPPQNTVETGNLTITYEPKRDGPTTEDGTPYNCNNFQPLNTSGSLSQLAVSSEYFDHYITTYTWPLNATMNGLPSLSDPLYFIASGLATSGTVEFIGTNAPADVIAGGTEGVVQLDVLVRVPLNRTMDSLARVCQLERADGSQGVGIFTPLQTDSGGAAPYLLNPLETPGFHTVIRLPPSMLAAKAPSAFLPNVSLDLAQMGVRIGNFATVAEFGHLDIQADCRGGGVVVSSVVAQAISIAGSEGTVQGLFNVSQALSINSTSGTILANVILHNPSDTSDNSTTLTSTMPGLRRRYNNQGDSNNHGNPQQYQQYAEYQAQIHEPTHWINTTFLTNEGFIFVDFLHHPPSTALQTTVMSQSGIVDVSMHPNFVGPFALENLWGAIRLPPLASTTLVDPLNMGRSRMYAQGTIDVANSTFFDRAPLLSHLSTAATSVTGAAFWAYPRGDIPTPLQVQNGAEGKGSGLVALANLGDLQVTFDGT